MDLISPYNTDKPIINMKDIGKMIIKKLVFYLYVKITFIFIEHILVNQITVTSRVLLIARLNQ